MKKWMFFILFFITASGTFIPCCQNDDCCEDTTTSSGHNKHQPEGSCSPFFACATCPVSVEPAKSIRLIKPVIEKQVHQERIVISLLAVYSSSFWQPPRTC